MNNSTNNQKINGIVTEKCNEYTLTKKQRYFLEKAKRINVKRKRPFSCGDFPELSDSYFRQMIYRLKTHIEMYVKSTPCYYKVKGVTLSKYDPIVTDEPMGDNMIDVLLHVKEQPAAIHDIKLQFSSDLHRVWSKKPSFTVNPRNKCIVQDFPGIIPNVFSKVLVYPDLVQIDVSCTFSPLIYNVRGALDLVYFLGKLYQILCFFGDDAEIPEIWEWLVVQYHFGKDGKEELGGKTFHRTIEEFSDGIVRFYSKKMPDGKIIPRFEQICSPQSSLDTEIDKMVTSEDMTRFA